YSSAGRPPIPQSSSSTSSMTTNVVDGSLSSTSWRSRVTPSISCALASRLTPLGVTLMLMYGMSVLPNLVTEDLGDHPPAIVDFDQGEQVGEVALSDRAAHPRECDMRPGELDRFDRVGASLVAGRGRRPLGDDWQVVVNRPSGERAVRRSRVDRP